LPFLHSSATQPRVGSENQCEATKSLQICYLFIMSRIELKPRTRHSNGVFTWSSKRTANFQQM